MATLEAAAAQEKEMKEMKEIVDILKRQVIDLNTRLESAEQEVKKAQAKGAEAAKADEKDKVTKDIRGFDIKHMPRPEPYDGKAASFPAWNELFVAHFIAMDDKWEKVFSQVQKTKMQKGDLNGMKELMEKVNVREEEMLKVNKMLYVGLLQYTTGDARGKVMSNGPSSAVESYKYIYDKGTNATVMNVIAVKTRAMHPEQAVNMGEVEVRINKWREDIRYLRETGNFDFTEEQLKGILVTLLPDELQDHVIKKYNDLIDSEMMEEEIYVVVRRHEEKGKKKQIGSVTDKEENAKPDAYYWDYNYGGFIAMAVPAAKRQRTEDDDDMPDNDHEPSTAAAAKGKGKGGKGKGGPATGCFTCGGNHYASQCPKGKGKAKGGGKGGKGKGGKSGGWFSQKQWNDYYPGPSPSTWQSWYPYTGGKAKGKGGKGVRAVNDYQEYVTAPDGQHLSFPPLGACGHMQEEDWCHPCWDDHEAGNYGQLYNVVGKGGGNQESPMGWNTPQPLCIVTKLKDEEFEEVKSKKENRSRKHPRVNAFSVLQKEGLADARHGLLT